MKIITTKPTNVPQMSNMFRNPIQWWPRVFTRLNLPTQDIIDSNLNRLYRVTTPSLLASAFLKYL
jgi:hypothetical protein